MALQVGGAGAAPGYRLQSLFRTGAYKRHRGLFVGEEHENRAAMAAFVDGLPVLARQLDVILLEYYPQGTTPQGRDMAQIQADLVRFKKDYSGESLVVAQQVCALSRLAPSLGLEIWGVEQPVPPGTSLWDYARWRTGEECNQAFLDCADWFAHRSGRGSTRFCLYGGMSHARALKRLAPAMPAFVFVDGAFVEVDGAGRTPEGTVVT